MSNAEKLQKWSEEQPNCPLVSVIVPTYNSAQTIGLCLQSIRAQTYQNIELIVVDNYSTDETEQIAKTWGARFFLKGPERCSQRNHGAEEANGEWLVFIDSDMELSSEVMEECIEKIEKEKVDAIIIPEVNIGKGYWSKCKSFEKLIFLNEPGHEGVRFIREILFDRVGGFDEFLIAGEDWDIHFRIVETGAKIARVNSVIRHHIERLSLKSLIVKTRYYAKNIAKYYEKNLRHIKAREPIPLVVFKKRRLFLKDPIHGFGWLVLMLIEYAIYKIYRVRAGFLQKKG